MKCNYCGTEYDPSEKFCPQCGTPRPYDLPSMKRVQSGAPGGKDPSRPELEDDTPGQSSFQRHLLPALILIAGMTLMVFLYLEFLR